jgi:hypothetical protein
VRSTPVRLESALKKMEAGFAHGLHKPPESEASDEEKTTEESAVTH